MNINSNKVCPFVCRRALLGLQPGIPFKDRPSEDSTVYLVWELQSDGVGLC